MNGTAGPRSDHRPGLGGTVGAFVFGVFQSEDPLQVELAASSVYLRSSTSFPPQTGDNKIFILIFGENHFPKKKDGKKKLICGLLIVVLEVSWKNAPHISTNITSDRSDGN